MGKGFDFSDRHTYRLMAGRLGVYDKIPYDPRATDPEIGNLKQQSALFRVRGGNLQQERMIKDKRKSLDHAVWFSYQAAEVVRNDAELKKPVRALINPNKLKQDYDDKVISVGYEYNFKCGDVFEWLGTHTHWLIYLQDLTELAYFRGDIRRCRYEIKYEDEDGEHQTYAAIRGPVETKINYIQKHGISVDIPNYSLNLLLPATDENLKYFRRYTKFYLKDQNENAQQVCWRVEAINWLSSPGILEINAVEYYSNEFEDDVVNGVVGGLIVDEVNPNDEDVEEAIVGETFIYPKQIYDYTFTGGAVQDWVLDGDYPVILRVDDSNPRHVQLKWTSSYSGQFKITYGSFTKTIVVETLM